MESRVLSPALDELRKFAGINALQPEDWADIALKLADREDLFYWLDFEQKFKRLRRDIREMEEEAERAG